MAISPFIMSNKNGIPNLEATGVNVTSSNVVFTFRPHQFLNYPFKGIIAFKLPAYTAPTTAVPIVFYTPGGSNQALTTFGGGAVTSADLNDAGIYLAFFDSGTLQLINNI